MSTTFVGTTPSSYALATFKPPHRVGCLPWREPTAGVRMSLPIGTGTRLVTRPVSLTAGTDILALRSSCFCGQDQWGTGTPASPAIRMYLWREQSLRCLPQLARICMMAAMALAACSTSPQSGPTPQGGGPAFEMTVLRQTACPAALDAASCVRVRVTNRGTSGDGRCRLRGEATTSGGETQDVWGRWVVLNNIEHGVSVVTVTPWDGSRPAVGYCEPALHS